MSDLISRQAAIDIERNATVDTNPSHFEAHQKFTQFMDDSEISSFGRWQWSNGFNTALTAVGIDLKKLPSAQPEPCEDAVSREEVMKLLCRETCHPGARCPDNYCIEVREKVNALPSAEPEIIRCRDCKHWDTTWQNDFAPNYHYCPLIDGTRRGDFYCADADMRGDQND